VTPHPAALPPPSPQGEGFWRTKEIRPILAGPDFGGKEKYQKKRNTELPAL